MGVSMVLPFCARNGDNLTIDSCLFHDIIQCPAKDILNIYSPSEPKNEGLEDVFPFEKRDVQVPY